MNKAPYKTLLLKAIGIFSVSFLIMAMTMKLNSHELEHIDLDALPKSSNTTHKVVKKVRNGKVVDCATPRVSILINNHPTCHDIDDGSLTAMPEDDCGGVTYVWSSGQTTATISGLSAGTYTVSMTTCSETVTDSKTIVAPSAPLGMISTIAQLSCNGGADGSLLVTASGGTASTSGYTYLWSTTATSSTVSGLTAGTYTVTIMDENGCTATQTETVEEPAILTVSIEDALICYDETDGSLTATASGGTASYSYAWSNGGNASTTSGLTTGTYTVTVTDGLGCTATDTYTLYEAAELQATIDLDNTVSCNGGTDGQLTVNASGGGVIAPALPTPKCFPCPEENNYTFLWSTGAETSTISGLSAGTYTVTVTDDYGCTVTNSETVTEPTIFTVSIGDEDILCYGASDGMLTATTSGGTANYTYNWSNGGTSATVSGLTAGTYTVTVTDAEGCTAMDSELIEEYTQIMLMVSVDDNISCNGASDGQLTASATGGGLSLPPLAMPKCMSCPEDYTYAWSNGGTQATISGLSMGTYTVTVTDYYGCTATNSGTVTQPTIFSAFISNQINASCNSEADGSLTASASGGTATYTYVWNTGGTTATISGLSAGTYTITITDNNGCTATNNGTITEPAAIEVSIATPTDVSCNGGSDGQLTASVSSGSQPNMPLPKCVSCPEEYTYAWSNGGTEATISGLSAGTYTVTVTDDYGCTATKSEEVQEPNALSVSIGEENLCYGASDGMLTATTSGGTANYTYNWSNGGSTATISGLTAATYTVTVTDAEGCTATDSEEIAAATEIMVTVSVDDNVSCNGGNDGSLTASAVGGEPEIMIGGGNPQALPPINSYTYAWSNGGDQATVSGLSAGTYTVTVTDEYGCTATKTGTITAPSSLEIESLFGEVCYQASDGKLTATVSGGTPGYTYSWSNGGTTATISGLSAGTYTVTVTDAEACSMTKQGDIYERIPVMVNIATENISCNGANDGSLTATGSGGGSPGLEGPSALPPGYTYAWSNGGMEATISGLSVGTYTVTVTDEFGCTGTNTGMITEPAELIGSIVVDNNASTAGASDGALTASATGGTMPYTYKWSNTASTATISGLSAGTYTVTISDANACTDVVSESLLELASVGDNVWLDLDEDGVYDENEPGVPGVTIRLFHCTDGVPGDQVGSAVRTDEDGRYRFDNLLPGEYCLEFDPSTAEGPYAGINFEFTTIQGVFDNPIVGDPNARTLSGSFFLEAGENNLSFNVGLTFEGCFAPFNLAATECTENGATITWQTINIDEHDGIADHCWKVVVAGAGPQHAEFGDVGLFLDYLGAGLHASLIELSICADDPALTVEVGENPDTYEITYQLASDLIQPGTSYWFAVAEICDDMPESGNNSLWNFQRQLQLTDDDEGPFRDAEEDTAYLWDDYEGYFETKDEQFLVNVTVEKPTCPEESPGYEEDACIIVEITDGSTCWGTYNIRINDVLMMQSDAEGGVSDVAGFGQGTYTFCDYGVGTYTVDVEEVEDCNPPKSKLTNDAVEVPNGMDMEAPKITVVDFFAGGLIADNIEESVTDTAANLGSMDIPEGACSMKSYFYVTGVDNCDGEVCIGTSVVATVVASPEHVDPGTQVNIYNLDEEFDTGSGVIILQECEWVVEVNWAVGESTVEVCMNDLEEAGLSAPACITITAEVNDNIEPVILVNPINMLVPACRDNTTSLFDITILDGCDSYIDPDQLEVDIDPTAPIEFFELGFVEENGTIQLQVDYAGEEDTDYPIGGPFSITYTDDNGDEYEAEGLIVINKAAEETDPVITASGNAFTALACEDGAEVVIGVTVTDDCDDITDDLKISGVTGLSAAPAILNGLSGYFEFFGTLEPDEYSVTFTYPGADDVVVAVIVSQEDNNAPAVDMPGNTTFTIPSCQSTVKAVWSVQVTDDCDEEIDLDNVSITVDGGEITVPSDKATILAEGEGMVLIELTADLDLATDGAVFAVSYTDGGGETTSKQSTITVNGTPDVVPPVIIYPTAAISRELDPCGPNTTDIKFSVSAIDNCTGAVSVDVDALGSLAMSASPEGDAVKWTITYEASPTPYTITLTAEDAVGNTTEQTMWVSVTQGPKPPQNLACNTGLTAPVTSSCEVELTPDMVLEGTFGCLTAADIEIVVDGKVRGEADANYTAGTGLHEFDVFIEGAYFCTGDITTYDNIAPVITCPQTYTDFICTDIDELYGTLEFTGEPSTYDNCSGETYTWYEETLYGEDEACDDVRIKRVFTVTDGAGLTDECTQYITIRKPNLTDVTGPDEVIELNCDSDLIYDSEGHPKPTETGGYPSVSTFFDDHDLADQYCNLAATYADSDLIDICENSYKFIRTWRVIDWCDTDDEWTYTQLIKVGDFVDPVVEAPTADYDWDGELDVLEFSTGPFDCTAAFDVPLPHVSDNCSSTWAITTEILAGGTTPILVIEDGASRFVSGIPTGCHAFRYWVTDGCGNQTDITVPFVVVDKVAPVAVCNDDLNISIGGQGYARVHAEDIDEGSWDNCGPIHIEVRRLITEDDDCNTIAAVFSDWGDYVDFSCCDIDDAVRIEMRVWDDANGDGIPGNSITTEDCLGNEIVIADNSNVCWLDVTVEDKLNPYCIAPHNKSISCAELPYDFDPNEIELLEDLFGEADYADNCPGASVVENTPLITLDDCGTGTILRSFTATDAAGLTSLNSCQQLITITEVHNYEIRFPADAAADCGIADPDTVLTKEIGCDLLAVSVEDETFSASGDECYKILRTYRVINWCEYDGEAPPVIVSRDEDCDGRPGDEAVWVIQRNSGAVYFDRDNNETNSNPSAGEKGRTCDGLTNPSGYWINNTIDQDANRDPITGQVDNGTTNDNIRDIDSRGYWQYTQVIKVYDSADPVITVEAYDTFESLDNVDCDGLVSINFSIEDECTQEEGLQYVWLDAFIVDADNDGNFTQAEFVSDADMTSAVTGDAPDYTFAAELPQGLHALLIQGSDGCGNEAVDLIIFEVIDAKGPAPVCINGLAIELARTEPGTDVDNDGDPDPAAATIWASDFIASPIYDCNGQGPEVDEAGNPIVTAYSINISGQAIDRDDTSLVLTCENDPTTVVEIHAWDEAGNHDYCETYIVVQDFNNQCIDAEGRLAGMITTEEDVPVNGVEVSLNGFRDGSMTTVDDGYFEFVNLPVNDYSIAPQLDEDYLNGVSTLDIVLISKHILGEDRLASPYKMIAADINNSRSITTLDMIIARQNILGITEGFTNNTSWRFVDADYDFPDANNPWLEVFPEIKSFNDLQGDAFAKFFGVKIGDVNATARANNLMSIDDRNFGTFALATADLELQAGQTYEVAFTAEEIARIQGYQGTFALGTAIELLDIEYGRVTEEHFGQQSLAQGLLTTSWNGEAKPDEILFTLIIKAKSDAQLSKQLSLTSRITPSEAYHQNDDKLSLGIQFNTGKVAKDNFELYQNQPNPFLDETTIRFYLPSAGEGTISIQDVTGKIIKQITADFAQGDNQIMLKREDLAAKGTLFYTLTAGEYTATRKMIKLK